MQGLITPVGMKFGYVVTISAVLHCCCFSTATISQGHMILISNAPWRLSTSQWRSQQGNLHVAQILPIHIISPAPLCSCSANTCVSQVSSPTHDTSCTLFLTHATFKHSCTYSQPMLQFCASSTTCAAPLVHPS